LLCRHRTQTNTDEWRQFIAEEARVHPIKDLLHSDPFTRHAFTKPRGYPGDAELLDYMYAPLTTASDNSLAARISVYTTNAQAPEAVRDRRDAIARLIDATADEMKRKPRVLSLACGHLREAGMTTALRAGKVAELVALDQDEAALEVIQRDYGHMAVKTQLGSVKQILVRGLNDWGFDLIYAAGLFDYLSQPVGRRLCDVLFAALNPGGQLLVPNFMPGIRDVGYMEAFMDWFLIYRTEAQVRELIAGIPNFELSGLSSWTDERKNVVYLLACKRGLLQAR
jgi:SAM-dependent methyltransferase